MAVDRPGALAAIGRTPVVRSPEGITPTTIPRMMARAREIMEETGGSAGTHRIEGGGIGFPPPQLDPAEIDEVIAVSSDEAMAMARRAAREDGVWSGPSTGASLSAALDIARRLGPAARVAAIQVDSGLKYLRGEVYG